VEEFEALLHNRLHQFKKKSYRCNVGIRLNQSTRRRRVCHIQGSIHGDSSSLDNACSRPRWVMNNGSLDSSSGVPFDTPISSESSNVFENLKCCNIIY
jgi:hypothetical protein